MPWWAWTLIGVGYPVVARLVTGHCRYAIRGLDDWGDAAGFGIFWPATAAVWLAWRAMKLVPPIGAERRHRAVERARAIRQAERELGIGGDE